MSEEMDNKDQLFETYWSMTDRKRVVPITDGRYCKITDLHNWDNKAYEKSPTLRTLLEHEFVREKQLLPEDRNYTSTFEAIMKETGLKFIISELRKNEDFIREEPNTVCMAISVDTVPVWAFDGFGPNKTKALEAAARKGVKFLISVSSNYVIF